MAKVSSQGGLERLAASIAELPKKRAAVGFFDTAVYPDGTPVAYVATIQEFGHGSIPPRSFMRSTISEQKEAWQKTLAQGSKRVLADKMTVHQMLESFGMMAAGQVKEKIASITNPPLSMTTLLLRKHKQDSDVKIGGKLVGQKNRDANFVGPVAGGYPDISGVSTKPLVDTSYMLDSVDSKVEAR